MRNSSDVTTPLTSVGSRGAAVTRSSSTPTRPTASTNPSYAHASDLESFKAFGDAASSPSPPSTSAGNGSGRAVTRPQQQMSSSSSPAAAAAVVTPLSRVASNGGGGGDVAHSSSFSAGGGTSPAQSLSAQTTPLLRPSSSVSSSSLERQGVQHAPAAARGLRVEVPKTATTPASGSASSGLLFANSGSGFSNVMSPTAKTSPPLRQQQQPMHQQQQQQRLSSTTLGSNLNNNNNNNNLSSPSSSNGASNSMLSNSSQNTNNNAKSASNFFSSASTPSPPLPATTTPSSSSSFLPSITLSYGFIGLWTGWTAMLAMMGWLEASVLVLVWSSFAIILGLVWLSQLREDTRDVYVESIRKWYAEVERQTMLSYIVAVFFALRVMWALGPLVSVEVIIFSIAVAYIVRSNTKSDEEKKLMALNILAGSSIKTSSGVGTIKGGGGSTVTEVDVAADAELLRRVLGSDLPPWVSFPNIARGSFFNVLLKGMWPYMSEALDGSTRGWLDSLLSVYKPSAFSKLEMGIVRFGTIPIVVHGVESASVDNNSYIDLHISWAGDSDLRMLARLAMPPTDFEVQLKQFKLRGVLRIEFGNHIRRWPCFSTYSFSFVRPPSISFDLTFAGLNTNAIPWVREMIEDMIKHWIIIWLVHPNRLRYAAVDNPEETSSRADAYGLLHLRLRTVEGCAEKCSVKINLIGDDVAHKSNIVQPHKVAADASSPLHQWSSSADSALYNTGSGINSSTATTTNAKTGGLVAEFDDYFQLVVYDKNAMLKFVLNEGDRTPLASSSDYVKPFIERSGNNVGRAVALKRRHKVGAMEEQPNAALLSDYILRYDAQFFPFLTLEEGTRFWQERQQHLARSPMANVVAGKGGTQHILRNNSDVNAFFKDATTTTSSINDGSFATRNASSFGNNGSFAGFNGTSGSFAPNGASNTSLSSPATPLPPSAEAVKQTALPAETVYFSQGSAKVEKGATESPYGIGRSLLSNAHLNSKQQVKERNAKKPVPLAVLFVNINRCQNLLCTKEHSTFKTTIKDPDPFARARLTSIIPGCDQHVDTHVVKQNRHPAFWIPASFIIYHWEDRVSFEVFDDVDAGLFAKLGAGGGQSSNMNRIGKVRNISLDEIAMNGCFLKDTRALETEADVEAGTITFEITLRIIAHQ